MLNYYAPLEADQSLPEGLRLCQGDGRPDPRSGTAARGFGTGCPVPGIQDQPGCPQSSGRLRLEILEPGHADEGRRGLQRAHRRLPRYRPLGKVRPGHPGEPQEIPQAHPGRAPEGRRGIRQARQPRCAVGHRQGQLHRPAAEILRLEMARGHDRSSTSTCRPSLSRMSSNASNSWRTSPRTPGNNSACMCHDICNATEQSCTIAW